MQVSPCPCLPLCWTQVLLASYIGHRWCLRPTHWLCFSSYMLSKCFSFWIFMWSMYACLTLAHLQQLECMPNSITLHAFLFASVWNMLDAECSSILCWMLCTLASNTLHCLNPVHACIVPLNLSFGNLPWLLCMIYMSSTASLHLHHIDTSRMHVFQNFMVSAGSPSLSIGRCLVLRPT